jgi:hypothetical protein
MSNEDWNDEFPDWSDTMGLDGFDDAEAEAERWWKSRTNTGIDIVDDAFNGVKDITEALTTMMLSETRHKDVTITKLQYVIEHLLRCVVSLTENKEGMLIGGCVFLPSKDIVETKATDIEEKTTHVHWGDDLSKRERAVWTFFNHMMKSTKEEIAQNDWRRETLTERFQEKMDSITKRRK